MSELTRIEAARLRRKYARQFDVPIDLVEVQELPEDDAEVRCPTKPELPRWTTGPLGPEKTIRIRSRKRRP